MAGLNGKLVLLKVGNVELACQTDLTINFTANTSEPPTCKPASGEDGSDAEWVSRNVDSREWDASVSAQALAGDLATLNDVTDLIGTFVNDSLKVSITVLTNDGSDDYDKDYGLLFTGDAIMNGLTFNAGGEDVATGDVTFISDGKPEYTKVDLSGD